MKSILFIVSTLVRAGPNQQLLNLCKYLPEFGWRPHVLTLSQNPPENLAREFSKLGVPTETLGLSRLQGLLHAERRVREVLRKLDARVVHTSGFRSDAIGIHLSNIADHVMTIRNFAWDDYPAKFGQIRGSLMAARHCSLIKKAQMPVACSRAIAKKLSVVRPGMCTVQNGVDVEKYSKAGAAERTALRKQLGLDPSSIIILSVGSLIPRKRPLSLLKSFLNASFDRPADLLFLGDGPLRGEVEASARNLDNVRVLGSVDNTADYYRCADIFASASVSEGLPNSVLEALACGLPVVLSDIEAHLEFDVDRHRAGVTCKLGDEDDFVRKLEIVTRDDWTSLSENAHNLAHRRFSARAMAEDYSRLYYELGG